MIFGSISTSIPGTNGFSVVPSTGMFAVKLSAENTAPIGNNLVLGTDYVISELGGSNNEIYAVDDTGNQMRLEPVFAENFPSPLDANKVYICPRAGFKSAMYFSPAYLNYTIKYKVAAYASIISDEMMNLLLRPGKIEFSIFPDLETSCSTLCDGKLIDRNKYPLYTQRVFQIPKLTELLVKAGDPVNQIRVPNFKDVMPLLTTGASDVTDIIAGGTLNKSTIARAGFKNTGSITVRKSKENNKRGYNTAGAPFQFNGDGDDVSVNANLSPNFDDPVSRSPNVQFHDWFNAPPYCVLYPFIIIR